MSVFRTFFKVRKRVKQRATRYSLLVVILLFGLFLEAYMHNFNLVYITLFFVFAAAFSAGPTGILNIGQLEASFDKSRRLFAGRDGECLFRVRNASSTPAWAIELHCNQYLTKIQRIEGNSEKLVSISVKVERRGRLECDSCRLQSFFPLSTVRFIMQMEKCCKAVVYPRPYGKPLKSFLAKQQAHFGEERDFDGLRSYSGAESMSRIHWPSVAKGEPSVKQFSHEMHTDELTFDFKLLEGDTESRLSQLTLWVLECEKSRENFMIILPYKTLDSRKESIDAILEHFALY